MARRTLPSVFVLLLMSNVSFGQQPARNSEAAMVGLRGPVHTVLTESFDFRDNPQGKPTGSVLAIYDPQGYLLEEYRYDPGGALHSHRTYTRKGWQVFKTETTSANPSENRTFLQSFNSEGLVTGTETHDGSGLLIDKTNNDFQPKAGANTVSSSQTTEADGTVSTSTTIESTDAATGMSRQSVAKDGKPYSDWLVQRDRQGKPVVDVLKFADGSLNEREVKPDGTTVEHKYWAPTKTHTHQTTDAHNRILEVIDESPNYYTKATYQYDDAGRRKEIANYDRSGKVLRKGITKYQEDANGNWIEEKEFLWEAATGSKWSMLATLSRRIITYY